MNYIRELLAFDDWLKTNDLAPSSILLWHALMLVANKTGWKNQFTVATSVLELKTRLKRDTIFDARKKLEQAGLIRVVSRSKGQCAIYEMISLDNVSNNQTATTAQTAKRESSVTFTEISSGTSSGTSSEISSGTSSETSSGTSSETSSGTSSESSSESSTITKRNETKRNETKRNHIELCVSRDGDMACALAHNPKHKTIDSKVTYGEFQNVKLTQEEYDKLLEKFGSLGCMERIERLSEYIASKNTKHTNHYATILSWARKEGLNQGLHQGLHQGTENDNMNQHMIVKGISKDSDHDNKDTVNSRRNRSFGDLNNFCKIDFQLFPNAYKAHCKWGSI